MAVEVTIGEAEQDRVLLRILGRTLPEASDVWDGNWVNAQVEVHAGAWNGCYDAQLRLDDLKSFRRQLETLYSTLRGEAHLDSLEPWLRLSLRVDRLGGIAIEGTAADRPPWENSLTFSLAGIDQSYVPAILGQLRVVERELPLRGDRDP